MRFRFLLSYCLGVIVSSGNPTDPEINPKISVDSSAAAPVDQFGTSKVRLRFSVPNDVSQHNKVPNFALREVSPELGTRPTGGTFEDIDGDNDLDMVIVKGDKVVVHFNQGTRSTPKYSTLGTQIAVVSLFHSSGPRAATFGVTITFGDIDSDGKRDLVCGEGDEGQVSYFKRTSASNTLPVYGSQTAAVNASNYQIAVNTITTGFAIELGVASIAVEDLNGDGKMDLIVGDPYDIFGAPISLWVYKGTGLLNSAGAMIFESGIPLKAGGVNIQLVWQLLGAVCPAFADIDADGDRDLVIGTSAGKIYTCKRVGVDTDPSSTNFGLPLYSAPVLLLATVERDLNPGAVSALTICDFSNDGDLDLAIVSSGANILDQYRLRLMENFSSSSLSLAQNPISIGIRDLETELRTTFESKAAYFDFDKDGKPDVLYAGTGYGLALAINLDTGNHSDPQFAAPVPLAVIPEIVGGLPQGVPEVVDFDKDNSLDVNVDGVLVGTLDDLLFLPFTGFSENGLPRFGSASSILPAGLKGTLHFLQPSVGDLNGDGKLDVVAVAGGIYSGESRSLKLFVNSGTNSFFLSAPTDLLAGGVAIVGLFPELVDLNGDLNLDLILSKRSSSYRGSREIGKPTVHSYFNAGGVNFVDQGEISTVTGTPISVSQDAAPRAIDFDKDGLLDIMVCDSRSAVFSLIKSDQAGAVGRFIPPVAPEAISAILPVESKTLTSGRGVELDFNQYVTDGAKLDCNDLLFESIRVSIAGSVIQVDSDADGLSDAWEVANGFNPLNADQDSDGILDGLEDADSDGFPNYTDSLYSQNPATADPDGSGMPASVVATGAANKFIGWWDFQAVPSPTTSHKNRRSNTYLSAPISARISGCISDYGIQPIGAGSTSMNLDIMRFFKDTTDFSFNFWVQIPENELDGGRLPLQAPGDADRVITLASFCNVNTVNPSFEWRARRSPGGGTTFEIQTWTNSVVTTVLQRASVVKIDDGKWHHVAFAATGRNLRMFVDGVPLGTNYVYTSAFLVPPNIDTTGGWLMVGGTKRKLAVPPTASTFADFRGKMDNLMVHTRVLTPTEIDLIYRRDRDLDGLWDVTEMGTEVWRDLNSNGNRDSNEISYLNSPTVWQDPTTDSDRDGLSDIDEQNMKLRIEHSDFDGDLLPDGWEVQNGLNPKSSADANLDPDGDGLTNLQEWKYNTNPHNANSDGDSKNDGAEVGQGSDPNDGSDGGQAPAPGETFSAELAIGDESGSESEDYVLNCYKIDQETGQEKLYHRVRSGGFGEFEEETFGPFKKGETYTFQISWQGSKFTSQAASPGVSAEGPDFDYTFKVVPISYTEGVLIDSWDPKTGKIDTAKKLIADNADNVATTVEEFRENFEDRRVVLTSLDFDIIHPASGELAEDKEFDGRAGIVAVEGSTTTPITKLRLQKNGWLKNVVESDLANTPRFSFEFDSGGRFEIDSGAGVVTAGATHYASGAPYDYKFKGLNVNAVDTASDSIFMHFHIGSDEYMTEAISVTTVKAEYDVYFDVYIPYDWVTIIHPFHLTEVACGDDRGFSPLSLKYRLKEQARINPYEELSSTGFAAGTTPLKFAGLSVHYDKGTSLPDPYTQMDHQGVDISNRLFAVAKAEAETPANSGAPYKTNWGTATVDKLGVIKSGTGTSLSYKFVGGSSEPLIALAAEIDWEVDLIFDTSVVNRPTCRVDGATDGFPAYQCYAFGAHEAYTTPNRTNLVDWKPPLFNNVLDLISDLDTPLTAPATNLK